MKDIVLDKILSVGNEEIDRDHRILIDLFNNLNHSVTEGAGPDYLAAILEELINCTVWHFSHEDRLMLKYGYGEMEDHRVEHQELIKTARELQQEILHAEKSVSDQDIVLLERWLTEHILTYDMRLGAYLSQVM